MTGLIDIKIINEKLIKRMISLCLSKLQIIFNRELTI
jgi:hypothetical protein